MATRDRPGSLARGHWLAPAALAWALSACQVASEPEIAAAPGDSETRSVSIVSYDAGETLGLLPVSRLLTDARVEVEWLPLTPWAAALLERESLPYEALPEGAEQMPHVEDRHGASDVETWVAHLRDRQPELVILGMVSEVQRQIAAASREAGMPTIGFYSGFDPPPPDAISLVVAGEVDEVWVPSGAVRDGFMAGEIADVWLAGQPSVEAWYRLARETEPARIRAAQGLGEDIRYVLYAGQYGDGYDAVLHSFIERFSSLGNSFPELLLVVSHHPRTSGALERTVIEELGGQNLVMAAEGLSTAELATTADVVVTWRSTVGVQAAFIGKPVIYYDLGKVNRYSNELTRSGVALATTPETVLEAITEALRASGTPEASRQSLARLGYVLDSDQRIANKILEMLAP